MKTFTFEVKGVVHTKLPHKKNNYNDYKSKCRPDESLFELSMAWKLQEQKLSQRHKKEKKNHKKCKPKFNPRLET